MQIEINTTLAPFLTTLATAHGKSEVEYLNHVVEKHLLGQMKNKAQFELSILPVEDIKTVSDDITAKYDAVKIKPEPPIEDQRPPEGDVKP